MKVTRRRYFQPGLKVRVPYTFAKHLVVETLASGGVSPFRGVVIVRIEQAAYCPYDRNNAYLIVKWGDKYFQSESFFEYSDDEEVSFPHYSDKQVVFTEVYPKVVSQTIYVRKRPEA